MMAHRALLVDTVNVCTFICIGDGDPNFLVSFKRVAYV